MWGGGWTQQETETPYPNLGQKHIETMLFNVDNQVKC